MSSISFQGSKIIIVASVTFPAGFTLSSFAHDTDALATENSDLADAGVTVGGAIVTWAKTALIEPKIAVAPNSDEDNNLYILARANRPTIGKIPAGDVITMTLLVPGKAPITARNGVLVNAPLFPAGKSDGQLFTRVYGFKFEDAS